MVQSFDEILVSDADIFLDIFCDPVEALYQKLGESGSRSIRIVIDRQEPEGAEDRTKARFPVVTCYVKNSSLDGISAEEIDTGSDKIYLAPRQGCDERYFRIVRIISQDSGILQLELK